MRRNFRMVKKKVLNIISDNFPYGGGEQFFEAEVTEMARYFDEVVLFPLHPGDLARTLPKNVTVNSILAKTPRNFTKKEIFWRAFLIFRIVGYEFIRSNKRGYILKKMKRWMSSIVQCSKLSKAFESAIDSTHENYFYSFWMNDGALMLALLKAKGKIDRFSFRVNGFDIFNERHESNYMPFRYYNYKHVNRIFVLSKGALAYLQKLNIYPEKLVLAHYGIFEKGLNQLDEQTTEIRIVSCANVIPLKRIDKMIDALGRLNEYEVHWTHFGDGYLMDEIQQKAAYLSPNIKVEFKGNRPNSEVLELYKSKSINLFVHTSETEGLGMAIIEAQSFGIPAVVIGVGGVLDIVSDKTGVVLNQETEGEGIAEAIRWVLNSEMNKQAYRKTIQNNCLEIFNAQRNYRSQFEVLAQPSKSFF